MDIYIKNGGTYSNNIQGVYQKYAGTYHVAAGTFHKSALTYNSLGLVYQNFDYLAVVGSSTTAYTFISHPNLGFQGHAARQQYCSAGIDLPILTDLAISGATCETLRDQTNGAITTMNLATMASAGKKVGCIINIGSNNIGGTSYASANQAFKDSMTTAITQIVQKIQTAGGVPILGSINPRYQASALYREWNDNLIIPLARTLTPDYVPLVNGVPTPVYDLHTFYGRNQAAYPTTGVNEWFLTDNTHPGQAGMTGIRSYTSTQLRLFASVPKMTRRNSVIFGAHGSNAYKNYGGINLANTGTPTITSVIDREGNVISGATFTHTANAWGTTARGNAGEWTVGWEHDHIQKQYLYHSTTSWTATLTLGASYANKSGTLYVTYNTKNNRTSQITCNGINYQISGYMGGALTGIIKIDVPYTLDSSGSVQITIANVSGGFPGISGLEYVFDWLYQ